MLAIEVEYLMGRAMATRIDERDRAEWPPHPQRLFSALVAAQAELDLGEAGRAALEWLEALPPPAIAADLAPSFRRAAEHFVPVNDEAIRADKTKADFRHPLDRRNRQSRFFPAAVPRDPVVTFQWRGASGAEHQAALRTLVENLTYLGHSASPVRACLRETAAPPTLVPDQEGDYELRVPGPGRLRRLEAVHRQRALDESLQPPLGLEVRYANPAEPRSVFSAQALVLAFADGPRLSLDITLPLLRRLREALLARLSERLPEALCGHDGNGGPARKPHLALVPLGRVGAPHADGALRGAALVLPCGIDPALRRRLRGVLDLPWPLHLGPLGSLTVQLLDESEAESPSLQFPQRYAGRAAGWASVTPVVLDRHPKKSGPTIEAIIGESCRRIGLPTPLEVRAGSASSFIGAPPVHAFRGGDSKQTDGRLLRHVLLRFAEPVRGPLLLGAGRFFGLGLCRPWTPARPA